LPLIKAIIFDFIGTLTNVKNYTMEDSKIKLHEALVEVGVNLNAERFLEAYDQAHEKYRVIRYGELTEVTNAVWVSEALNNLGFKTNPKDAGIKTALNIFFEEYLASFELRPCVKKLLNKLSTDYKLGLVSNFTYAPVIYTALRRLDINNFFDAVLVSEAVVWRKPHMRIFQETLRRLGVSAKEAVYVGDSPLEDIKGAKALGMRTVFVPSMFYSLENMRESQQAPDMITKDICDLYRRLPAMLKTVG